MLWVEFPACIFETELSTIWVQEYSVVILVWQETSFCKIRTPNSKDTLAENENRNWIDGFLIQAHIHNDWQALNGDIVSTSKDM